MTHTNHVSQPNGGSENGRHQINGATTRRTLKERMQNGEVLYGMSVLSFSPTMIEIAAFSGYDFILIDMEHGYGGIAETLPCIHALIAANTPVIVRVPDNNHVWVKKILDLGPQGIVFPMIGNAESAREAVSYCRYPPNGVRGVGIPIVRASKYALDLDYLTRCEKDLLVLCQIETEEGVNNVEEIAGVDGVDALMVGPYDLSASVGCLMNPNHEKVREMVHKIEKAVLNFKRREDGGPFLAGFALGRDGAEQFRSRGYQLIRGACDVVAFKNTCVEDVTAFKKGSNSMKASHQS